MNMCTINWLLKVASIYFVPVVSTCTCTSDCHNNAGNKLGFTLPSQAWFQ